MELPAFNILLSLEDEVKEDTVFDPKVSSLVNLFIKYLKEPRYQSPLTISELSKLFQLFFKDLNALVLGLYTQSRTTKKELIAKSSYFNKHPHQFDYLLAIANYSTSSVKLSKRSDGEALQQLRIFNYYKFLYVFYVIEKSQYLLFDSVSGNEDIRLYEKIYRFDQRDILLQEYLDKKIADLRCLNLSFNVFYETEDQKILDFVEGLNDNDLSAINDEFLNMTLNITPYSKLITLSKIQKTLVKILSRILKPNQINNDIILPFIIYLAIAKVNAKEIYLNLVFIKNFIHFIDPDNIDLIEVNLNSAYAPSEKTSRAGKANLFELLNLNLQYESNKQIEGHDFFLNDNDMMSYILSKYLNNGELSYYLTNLEAVISFLFNITLPVLYPGKETTSRLLLKSIDQIVNEDIIEATKEDSKNEEVEKSLQDKGSRSRSSSILTNITTKINDTRTRSRSNSSNPVNQKTYSTLSRENFPSFNTDADTNTSTNSNVDSENTLSMTMMRSLIGKLSNVSVQQLRPYIDPNQVENYDDTNGSNGSATHRRSGSFMSRLSPSHSRTRSSSIETAMNTQPTPKRNTITSKLSNGVSEFMTKLNTPNVQHDEINKNISNSSLHSLDNCQVSSNESSVTINVKPDFNRTRTTSLQIMDKWFNNISANQQQQQLQSNIEGDQKSISKDLFKYKNTNIESMTINDIKHLKKCYDKLCMLVMNEEDNISDKTPQETPAQETPAQEIPVLETPAQETTQET